MSKDILKQNEDLVIQVNNALELDRKIIGIKLFDSKKDYEAAEAQQLKGKIPYCVMVKSAMEGASIKAKKENFGCPDGAVTLGIYDPMTEGYPRTEPGYFVSGKRYADPGVYKDLETAQKVMDKIIILEDRKYGVMLKPLELYDEEPDTVMIVGDTYNTMRLIQGYTYEYGTFDNFRIAGNQAICSESTAYPLVNDNINMSVLCTGTRTNSEWKKSDLSLGMPYHMFKKVVNGLYQTINPLVRDVDKKKIEENMKKTNQEIIEIEYGQNYDSEIYTFGEEKRRTF